MLQSARFVLVLLFAFVAQSFAGTTLTPNTTLSAETGNNTSAANSFVTSTNGNMGAGNVSKEDVHKLLSPGLSAKIYAHYLGWWGSGGHINIGYDAATLAQAHSQVSDMMSRGIDGLIVDWYGQGNTRINQATLYVKQDAETRGGKFEFAIMEDQGAIHTCAYTVGCDVTAALIKDLNYINSTYASSPAYMRVNGQPVIFTFDVENLPNIDWVKVMASVQGNPKIVLRNNQGFALPYTSGSYAWVAINKSNQGDWAQGYLDNFYNTSRLYPSMLVYPGTWKGFNDTMASWSENRIMSQNCGQVWLQTFAEAGKYFTGTQAAAIQLVTWNDYEEGTEIETGIDNCVSVNASATSAGDVSWQVSGQENTIDHYSVFISSDGQNLMKLADVAAGTHSYSLTSFGFASGNYTVFVKAVGKPSMRNKMSPAVPVTLAGNAAPTARLSVTPNTGTAPVTVTASTAGSSDSDGTIASTQIDFGDGTVLPASSGSHIYAIAGTFTVKANVTDNNGATGSATAVVTVKENQAPTASIAVNPASGTSPIVVTASTAASTDADGTIVSSTIDFGDGTVVNGPTASHTYSTAGTYTVKGTVKDNGGLTAVSSTTVTVSAPVFTVNPASPADNSTITGPVRFAATTTSGSLVTAVRVYVDNVSLYTVNATSLDTTLKLSPGAHYVVLQAWNQAGQVAKTPLHVTVANQAPSASLVVTPSGGVAPVVVSATASGTDTDGTVAAMSIDFGDGTVVNGATGSHTYAAGGTYTVTAKVTDNMGATSIAKSTVSVTPNGITLIRPSRGSVATSPVAVTATAGAPYPIVSMRVYVDSVARYSLNSFSSSYGTLDTTVAMSRGIHNVVVQAWDSRGTVYRTSASINVQ